ncbi:MAG TPA: LuxR C-terminal-related transcriptional regulator [Ktedonobacterales bacterium]
MDGSWLLLTKLAPPPARPGCLRRERLFERLDAGIARRLVLVATPAGYGKTTLLSSWYAAHAVLPVSPHEPALAWLTLENAENDPARFWRYVLRALQQARKETPDHPLLALEMSPRASTETFLTALLNAFSAPRGSPALATPGETVLILDEYQVITNQAIHSAVTFLLEHLPPSLHLVLASRTSPPLPLTKLRASGSLAALGAEELRFSAEEIARFLQSTLPLSFTLEEVARLEAQTGGWIMPLHLAALAWQGRQDTAAFLASLRGDHHAIVEYLVAEVFGQQSADIQRFLLATSLLVQCTGALCDAVLPQTNSQRILEYLEREHLLLVPLDAMHQWYRHHPLFVGFLQDRLRQTYPEEIAGWHRRAADWYLQQASAEGDAVSRALPHLLAVRDWARAARLIEAASERMLWQSGEMTTLLHWLEELPQELFEERPRLALASAWALTLTGQFDTAETTLQNVERFLSKDNEQATDPDKGLFSRQLSGEALAVRARIATFVDVERASALSEQALQRLPEQSEVLQADLLLNLGYAHLRSHDFVAAGRAFEEARRIGRRSGNVRAIMLSSRYLAVSYVMRGLLNEATTVYRQALRLAIASGQKPPLAAGTIYIGNALLLYERNEVDAALDQAQRGLALGLRSGEIKSLFPGYLALAQIYQGLGDLARAWQSLDDAERLADLHLFAWTEEEIAAAQARLHLEEGEIGLAVRVLSRTRWQFEEKQALPLSVCPPIIQLAWARVLLAQQRPDAAAALLQQALEKLRRERPQMSELPVMVLQALALAASGAGSQALSLLAGVLPFAIGQGYLRTFVDEGAPMATLLRQVMQNFAMPGVKALLAAFPPALQEAAQPNGVGFLPAALLSAREVEVMRLLAAGLSNQQIADELVVALSTVRTHTKHIYRKLGVQGRVHAVARATSLHLL